MLVICYSSCTCIPDFGDYSNSYYSVQTTEGEPIAQLIAGYIDINLKKRSAVDHIRMQGDDGSAMVEDNVAPTRLVLWGHFNPKGWLTYFCVLNVFI